MTIVQWLNKSYMMLSGKNQECLGGSFLVRPFVICNDGFSISIQASSAHYCRPKKLLPTGLYESVEVMYLVSEVANYKYMDDYKLLHEYGSWEGSTIDGIGEVFGYVPIELVQNIIDLHGGINDNFV